MSAKPDPSGQYSSLRSRISAEQTKRQAIRRKTAKLNAAYERLVAEKQKVKQSSPAPAADDGH